MDEIDNRDTSAGEIWHGLDDTIIKPGIKHVLILLALVILGFIVGAFGSISFPLDFGVSYFWMGIIIQQVGGIWFGAWGVLAGIIFPFFSNAAAHTPLLVSLAYLPANLIQSLLPAYVFRRNLLDPRLRSAGDYIHLFVSMLAANLLGALWSVLLVLKGFDLLDQQSVSRYLWGWFGGNMVVGIVFNFLILRIISSLVIKSGIFIKRWWS